MAERITSLDGASEQQLRDEIVRLNKVVTALINRAERSANAQRSDFSLFQTAVLLEAQIKKRTEELEAALRENEKINRALLHEKEEQAALIRKLEQAHNQLLQSEKLASIGQLAAGVAHEINNPIGFVNSNLGTLRGYVENLLGLVALYERGQECLASIPELRAQIEGLRRESEIDFLKEDVRQLIDESIEGTSRVRRIVQDLRDFSRVDSPDWQWADLHAGLESTLNVVWNEIKFKAEVVSDYGDLPEVECLPSQLNQVFMNILVNAAQAIPERGTITLRSGRNGEMVWISISDTGAGMAPEMQAKIFDPFFTTKPVGKGTGLGLSVSYGIVARHGGSVEVDSEVGRGTTFTLRLPIRQSRAGSV